MAPSIIIIICKIQRLLYTKNTLLLKVGSNQVQAPRIRVRHTMRTAGRQVELDFRCWYMLTWSQLK